MRNAFINELCALAQKDPNLWLVSGDVGFSVLEKFSQQFPDRYLNVGVSEQNMIGIATGLALSGKTVFAYSIANFPVFRALEQIRNDVCYHRANVKIVTVGAGFAYGSAGYTHHGVEDLAIMRTLSEMTVVSPGDPIEAREATRAIANYNGPCYFKLGHSKDTVLHAQDIAFELGKSLLVKNGNDLSIFCTGAILKNAIEAANLLEAQGIKARVLSFPAVKPIDKGAILRAARETKGIVTIEEHSLAGGFGSAVCEVLADEHINIGKVCRIGLENPIVLKGGSQQELREAAGLSPEKIAAKILVLLGRN